MTALAGTAPPDTARLDDLHPDAFTHDEDRAALQALREVPGLDLLLKALSGSTVERTVYASLSHSAVKLGPGQYRSLHAMVRRAAWVLDVPEPEAWLVNGYIVNASAFGFERYTIRLYQGLVDLLEPAEVQAVVAHEVGHIACEHMLYKSLATALATMGQAVLGRLLGPPASVLSSGLELAMQRWSRAAEYSCDRAALLVTRDPELVAATLARLGGPSLRYRDEFDVRAAVAQARDFDFAAGGLDRVMHGLSQLDQSHPEPILRARAILDWAGSDAYRRILAGSYPTRRAARERLVRPEIEGVVACRSCGGLVPETRNRCPRCGCHRAPAMQVTCDCGRVNDRRWASCAGCAAPLPGEG